VARRVAGLTAQAAAPSGGPDEGGKESDGPTAVTDWKDGAIAGELPKGDVGVRPIDSDVRS